MLKECLCCGETFDAGGYGFMVYCSRKCRERNRYDSLRVHTIKTCKCCGVEFDAGNDGRMEFCSRKCSSKHYKASKRIIESFVCKGCGKEFYPKGYDRTTYCSRECAYTTKTVQKEERIRTDIETAEQIRHKRCIVCGSEYIGNSRWCSDDCYKAQQHNEYIKYKQTDDYRVDLDKQKVAYANIMGLAYIDHACIECGVIFNSLNSRKYCSMVCCDRHNERLHKGCVSKAKRKRVWQRDGYVCQICGKKISGKEQPTVDHIIPLSIAKNMGWSKLQSNDESNLQTAHLLCNVKKGNRAINEQLRMNNIMIW